MANWRRWTIVGTLVVCLALGGTVLAKNPNEKQASEELEFGYKAAKRGYWQEALERFELADELTPNQPRILNNIAVALEANGRFDEARTTYQAGLAIKPSDSALKRNYDRFEEFYATFIAEPEPEPDTDTTGDSETSGEADDAS